MRARDYDHDDDSQPCSGMLKRDTTDLSPHAVNPMDSHMPCDGLDEVNRSATVKEVSGASHKVEFLSSDTVIGLKRKIVEAQIATSTHMRLVYRGTSLPCDSGVLTTNFKGRILADTETGATLNDENPMLVMVAMAVVRKHLAKPRIDSENVMSPNSGKTAHDRSHANSTLVVIDTSCTRRYYKWRRGTHLSCLFCR